MYSRLSNRRPRSASRDLRRKRSQSGSASRSCSMRGHMSAGHVMFVSRCCWKQFHIDQDQDQDHQTLVKRVCRVLEDMVCVDEQTVERLTDGFLSHYLPELCSSKRALQELKQNQVILLETLDQEVAKVRECNATIDLNALFTEAKVYHSKLVNIRREMIVLHDKTTRLKIRMSLFLHQVCRNVRERRLIAKPAKRSDAEPH
uniref:Biogenesis of lysosome-related organelles complex 1 subunit 6 n=1 Tax=Sinocyclocheilus rhinocerous TaxID=307959 RepID=A0A673GNW0_9TELE